MVLPTGAMGNLTGGYMAKLMGVPIGKLCAGVNINGENEVAS
jgi:threonine synthase